MEAVIQYDLHGPGGGPWYLVIRHGTLTVHQGRHDRPSLTLAMSATDYVDMIDGRLNGQMAFMSGKLKIAGDMGLAMKMQSLFKRA